MSTRFPCQQSDANRRKCPMDGRPQGGQTLHLATNEAEPSLMLSGIGECPLDLWPARQLLESGQRIGDFPVSHQEPAEKSV
jgi:hypothetical protein